MTSNLPLQPKAQISTLPVDVWTHWIFPHFTIEDASNFARANEKLSGLAQQVIEESSHYRTLNSGSPPLAYQIPYNTHFEFYRNGMAPPPKFFKKIQREAPPFLLKDLGFASKSTMRYLTDATKPKVVIHLRGHPAVVTGNGISARVGINALDRQNPTSVIQGIIDGVITAKIWPDIKNDYVEEKGIYNIPFFHYASFRYPIEGNVFVRLAAEGLLDTLKKILPETKHPLRYGVIDTAFVAAAKNGHTETLQFLLNSESSLLTLPSQKSFEAAFEIAAENGDRKTLKFLVEVATLKPMEVLLETLVQETIKLIPNFQQVLDQIREEDRQAILTDDPKVFTQALKRAVKKPHQETLNLLLKTLKVCVNALDTSPDYQKVLDKILEGAAEKGLRRNLELLLKDTEDPVDEKPTREVLGFLLKHIKDLSSAENANCARIATKCHNETQKLYFLMQASVDKAFEAAATNGNRETLKCLLDSKNDLPRPSQKGVNLARTAALAKGHREILMFLLNPTLAPPPRTKGFYLARALAPLKSRKITQLCLEHL